MTKDDIRKIKGKLPRGYIAKISQMAHVSEKTVWKVFKGLSANEDVINAAVKLIEEQKQRQERIKKLIEA